jgi:YegS/Rv2252/BmrU family lipid kinase
LKVLFIINPLAGGFKFGKNMAEAIRGALRSEKGDFEIKVPPSREGAKELSKDAVRKGYDAVFACGGDGTINVVASMLVDTDTALGIIQMGSGNGLGRALGIPGDLGASVRLLKDFRIRKIDVGEMCGRYFFATAGCGFDAHLGKVYNEGALSRRMRGMLPYYILAVREFFRYKTCPLTIRAGGFSKTVEPFIITAANTDRYGGKAIIAPGALPDDGLLDVSIIPKIGITKVPGLAIRLLSGNINRFNGFERIRSDKIEIGGSNTTIVHVDGEPFEWEGDILIRVLPGKLKVLVPNPC